MMPEPEENRLDQSLRDKFEDFSLEPSAPVWAGIEQRIAAPAAPPNGRRRPLPLPLLFGLVALLSGLAGWLLPHEPAPGRPVAAVQAPAVTSGTLEETTRARKASHQSMQAPTQKVQRLRLSSREVAAASLGTAASVPTTARLNAASHNPRAIYSNGKAQQTRRPALSVAIAGVLTADRKPIAPVFTASAPEPAATQETAVAQVPVAVPSPAAAADSTPATLQPLAGLERQVLVQLPSIATLRPGVRLPAGSQPALLRGLRAERAELLRLQRRTDSLLLVLGDVPAAPALARADTADLKPKTINPKPASRWSLLLAAAPEQNTLTLQGREGDSLTALRRNHETGRAGFSANLLAEYRLTPRLSVGGGVGYSTYGADLRITNKTTAVSVTYNTTTTTTATAYTSTHQTYSVRIIQIPQPSPVFNASGQVIRYDTVYVPRQDTVRTTTIQHDTVRTTSHVTTPLISKKETLTTRLLQPNYRFFTVPVLLRYRLAAPGTSRLWTDVAVGAQLQFFLGGTQVTTDDGENFRTEKITVGSGPFRALNVGLTGSLALNYALTNRFSVSVAPSLRWQALSLYKPETGLRQQPTATGLLFGLRFEL
ncbi:hypothetical protein [Hymenobacter properus]|uniref:Outer membrane protein beta-barrel domain-containing protein n=1 Tax=Hymenobacter properus TaxID=2791026 RepID=A0A931FLM9_9BACT|nr:hypothetical protein [Hymenobacter properus]MBF9143040.1 hypothetical protein [Hymenobacter properus]MBR7721848.1 hypothetical protein [Microvirga sp. SRT04]